MALTRKLLKAMGIEEEQIEQIITAHSETVEGLKEEIEKSKQDSERIKELEGKLEKANKELELISKDDYKSKYEQATKDFEDYKNEVKGKAIKESKKSAYEKLLKEIGIADKQIAKIVNMKDYDTIELDENGAIKDVDGLKKSETEEWGAFIVDEQTKKPPVENPPRIVDGKFNLEEMSVADYIKARKEGKI